MDYTILYIFIAILVAAGVTFAVSKLREKNKLNPEDLMLAIQLLNLSKRVVSELRLDKEAEILTISGLVIDGLEYAISNFDTEQDVIQNAYEFALEIALVLDANITEERKALLRDLIVIVFNNTYKAILAEELVLQHIEDTDVVVVVVEDDIN